MPIDHTEPMSHDDALELTKLRITEDHISWGTAIQELAQITHSSKASVLRNYGEYLKRFVSEHKPKE